MQTVEVGWCIDLPNYPGIVLSPGQNLQVITIQNCLLYGRLVHVGETIEQICRLWAVYCTKMRLASWLKWSTTSL